MTDQLNRDRVLPSVEEAWSTLSLTASDEEEIELWDQQAAKLGDTHPSPWPNLSDSQQFPGFLRESNESEHLSQLGDSTTLFSPNTSVEKSPEILQQVNETRFESRLLLFASDNPFKTSEPHGNTLKPRQARSKMVVEREPPKAATFSPRKQNQPAFDRGNSEKEVREPTSFSLQYPNRPSVENVQHPAFGKASPLQSQIQSAVFNIPKPHQPRAEHHRPTSLGYPHLQGHEQNRVFGEAYPPIQPAQSKNRVKITENGDFFEIPRPANHPTWSTHRPAQPTFSSFVPVNIDRSNRIGNFIDLTSTANPFDPDSAVFDNRFGAADPYQYVEAGKATENIKALLEGAFDDDEDKPRTRARKKKAEAAIPELVGKLQNSNVGKEQKGGEHDEQEEEEEEEEDDGTIEGLQIKLLPHQVEGVEWMREKEIGTKKKNGVLPKGGILADDVRQLIIIRGVTDCMIDGPWKNYTVHITHTHESSTFSFINWSR